MATSIAQAVQGDRQVPSNRPAVSARRRFGRQSFIADLPQRFANRETSAGECAGCAAQCRARTERAPQRPARPSRGRGEMDNLTAPSRVARGPGLPALQAHDYSLPPSATGMTRPDSSRSRQRHYSAPHRAGGTTRGQSAREPLPPIARALCLSCRSGNDRFDCVALAACPGRSATRHADARLRRMLLAVRCRPGTVPHTACATVPVLQRITTQSSVRRLRKLICVAAPRPGHALERLARDDDRHGFLESQCAEKCWFHRYDLVRERRTDTSPAESAPFFWETWSVTSKLR